MFHVKHEGWEPRSLALEPSTPQQRTRLKRYEDCSRNGAIPRDGRRGRRGHGSGSGTSWTASERPPVVPESDRSAYDLGSGPGSRASPWRSPARSSRSPSWRPGGHARLPAARRRRARASTERSVATGGSRTLPAVSTSASARAFARAGSLGGRRPLLGPGGTAGVLRRGRLRLGRTARDRRLASSVAPVGACKVGTARYHEPAVTTSGASAPRTSSSRSAHGDAPPAPARSSGQPKTARPARPGIARIIAIANQKGGVGKSTTAVSLGASLADLGLPGPGHRSRPPGQRLHRHGHPPRGAGDDRLRRRSWRSPRSTTRSCRPPSSGCDAVPSTIDLAGAEIELVSQFSRETRLKKALEPVREGRYDFVLLDCPPSLGLLTVNALTAAEELIVPIQCEYYALEGLGQLLRNVSLVQQNINPELRLPGIVMTMFDPRTKLSEQVVEEVQRFFGELVYDVIIPRTVRLSEAPGFGQPITVYDPKSRGAETYRQLAAEVAVRPPPAEPMPIYDDLPTVVGRRRCGQPSHRSRSTRRARGRFRSRPSTRSSSRGGSGGRRAGRGARSSGGRSSRAPRARQSPHPSRTPSCPAVDADQRRSQSKAVVPASARRSTSDVWEEPESGPAAIWGRTDETPEPSDRNPTRTPS